MFLGMFTMTFGYIIFNIGGLLEVCVNNTEILKFISLSSFGFLQQGLLWWLPTLIIEIWLQAFIEECKVTDTAVRYVRFCHIICPEVGDMSQYSVVIPEPGGGVSQIK